MRYVIWFRYRYRKPRYIVRGFSDEKWTLVPSLFNWLCKSSLSLSSSNSSLTFTHCMAVAHSNSFKERACPSVIFSSLSSPLRALQIFLLFFFSPLFICLSHSSPKNSTVPRLCEHNPPYFPLSHSIMETKSYSPQKPLPSSSFHSIITLASLCAFS